MYDSADGKVCVYSLGERGREREDSGCMMVRFVRCVAYGRISGREMTWDV